MLCSKSFKKECTLQAEYGTVVKNINIVSQNRSKQKDPQHNVDIGEELTIRSITMESILTGVVLHVIPLYMFLYILFTLAYSSKYSLFLVFFISTQRGKRHKQSQGRFVECGT